MTRRPKDAKKQKPRGIPADQIEPGRLDRDAKRVVKRLQKHGYEAYFVGGCVRDLLIGRRPKDFDVATSAKPSEIRRLFRNCRIIGRRFKLAHIFYGDHIIETATFRAEPRDQDAGDDDLLIVDDNEYGTAESDARRRDFTVNALFLDPTTHEIIDHVGGMEDLEARELTTIGDPEVRFAEDPVPDPARHQVCDPARSGDQRPHLGRHVRPGAGPREGGPAPGARGDPAALPLRNRHLRVPDAARRGELSRC